MFAIFETSHAPALIAPHKLGEIATREDASAFLAARGWTIVCFELDGADHADVAAARGSALTLFTVARIPAGI